MNPYRTPSKVLEEVDTQRAESVEREAYEWQDLIVDAAHGLTASRLVNQTHTPDKPAGHGDHYKVLPVADYRERLLRIAGLAVAAIESYDRQVLAADAVRAAAKPPIPDPPLPDMSEPTPAPSLPEKPF